jgi:hypothetical protein
MLQRILGVLLCCVVISPVLAQDQLTAVDIPEEKKVIRFASEFGLVNFYHYLHATLRTSSCEECHHTVKEVGEIKPCHECHLHEGERTTPSLTGTPQIAEAFHVRCKGCHQYTTQVLYERAGPVTCALCHLGKEHREAPDKHPR